MKKYNELENTRRSINATTDIHGGKLFNNNGELTQCEIDDLECDKLDNHRFDIIENHKTIFKHTDNTDAFYRDEHKN